MSQPPPGTGLCQTCTHVDSCVFAPRCGDPRVDCEEFDVPPAPPAADVRFADPAPPVPADPGLMGLCVNCESRAMCLFSRRPGGVWFCEEYR